MHLNSLMLDEVTSFHCLRFGFLFTCITDLSEKTSHFEGTVRLL